MHRLTPAILVLLCTIGGCPPPAPVPAPSDDETPPVLFDASPEPFVLQVQADRLTGTGETTFALQVTLPDGTVPTSTTWRVNAAEPFATTASSELTLREPGRYLVDVEASDANGQTASGGLLLQIFAADDASATTASIQPTRGHAGTVLQLESPTLNDPDSTAGVRINGLATAAPFRPSPGRANVIVPLEADDNLSEETSVSVEILIAGAVVETLNYTLLPEPKLFLEPGALTRTVLTNLPNAVDEAETELLASLQSAEAGLLAGEQAVLQAMLRFASGRIAQVQTELTPLLDGLPEAERVRLDQVLLASGIDAELLEALNGQSKRLRQTRNEQLVVELCRFHEILDQVRNALKALNVAAQVLNTYGLLTAGTPSGPTLLALSRILGELTQALTMLVLVADLVPEVLDELRVVANPNTLVGENDKAVVRVYAQLTTSDLCARGMAVARLTEFITNILTQRLTSDLLGIATPSMAREIYRHTYRIGRTDVGAGAAAVNEIQSFLSGLVGQLIQTSVDVNVLNELFQPMLAKLCALRDREQVPLQPNDSLLTLSPTSGGRFLNLQEETVDFFCDINRQGTVTLQANLDCGRRTLRGEATIACGLEPCTQNASTALVVEVLPTRLLDLPNSSCRNLSETLQRTDATITITNTDPERTVRIAAVIYRTSDQQDLTRGPCEGDNLRPGETIKDCTDRIGAGCEGGFGMFLEPGERSPAIPYICSQQFVYLDPLSDGTCGEAVIETVRENWLIQAVYCDNLVNEANFCSQVDPTMKQFALPGNAGAWTPIERLGCP